MAENTTYNRVIDFLLPICRLRAASQLSRRLIGIKTEGVYYSMSGKFKLCIFALSFALSIVFATAACAQAAAAAQPGTATAAAVSTKIGIVNIQDAIIATNEGKKEFDALQARFAPKQNDLKALNDEVESMKKDLQAKEGKLNEDEKIKQVKLLETKQKTLQRNYEDAQNEFQQAEQEVVNRIGGKMLNVLEKYAKNNGYSVILDVSNPQTPVLWASQGTNITKELVDAYNTEAPVTSATPSPRPAGAAANRTPSNNATTPKKP